MRKLFALLAAIGLCFTVTACGSDACEDAADKILSCWKSMDCSKAGAGAAVCEAAKKAATSGNTDSGGSCEGQALAAAEEINKCTLDPEQMCVCKQ